LSLNCPSIIAVPRVQSRGVKSDLFADWPTVEHSVPRSIVADVAPGDGGSGGLRLANRIAVSGESVGSQGPHFGRIVRGEGRDLAGGVNSESVSWLKLEMMGPCVRIGVATAVEDSTAWSR